MDQTFRQLPAYFRHVPMLGYRWRAKYCFDLVMMKGCHIAPYICQCTTSMITYLHIQNGYFLINYVDDFLGIEYEDVVLQAHKSLKQLLTDIGVG